MWPCWGLNPGCRSGLRSRESRWRHSHHCNCTLGQRRCFSFSTSRWKVCFGQIILCHETWDWNVIRVLPEPHVACLCVGRPWNSCQTVANNHGTWHRGGGLSLQFHQGGKTKCCVPLLLFYLRRFFCCCYCVSCHILYFTSILMTHTHTDLYIMSTKFQWDNTWRSSASTGRDESNKCWCVSDLAAKFCLLRAD